MGSVGLVKVHMVSGGVVQSVRHWTADEEKHNFRSYPNSRNCLVIIGFYPKPIIATAVALTNGFLGIDIQAIGITVTTDKSIKETILTMVVIMGRQGVIGSATEDFSP